MGRNINNVFVADISCRVIRDIDSKNLAEDARQLVMHLLVIGFSLGLCIGGQTHVGLCPKGLLKV